MGRWKGLQRGESQQQQPWRVARDLTSLLLAPRLPQYLEPGAKGRFIGTWSAFTIALFAYIGSELIGVTAGEAKNPRKTLPKAIKSLFYRILFFYILLIFLVGLIVNSDDPLLIGASKGKATAAASPFVVAIKSAGIPVLPSVLNGCFLVRTIIRSYELLRRRS